MSIQETLKALGKAISASALLKATIKDTEGLIAQLPADKAAAAHSSLRHLDLALAANQKLRYTLHSQLSTLDQEATK